MVPTEGESFGEGPLERLGWVVAVLDDPYQRVQLLVGGHTLEPVLPPREGFRRDAFGVGARALIRRSGHTLRCTVHRRRGPIALVEFADEARSWVPVLLLGLQSEGVNPGDDASSEIRLAPWSGNDRYYPAVIVNDEEREDMLVRVAFLDESTAWVARDSLCPLPTRGARVHFDEPDGTSVTTIVVSYPSPWVVQTGHLQDRTTRFVALNSLYVTKSDREQ